MPEALACPSCGAAQTYEGVCHGCFYKFSGGDPYPETHLKALRKFTGRDPLAGDWDQFATGIGGVGFRKVGAVKIDRKAKTHPGEGWELVFGDIDTGTPIGDGSRAAAFAAVQIKELSAMTADPVYMEKIALAFLRAWPDVPEALRPVYPRFVHRGLLWIDPNVDWNGKRFPGALRLTEAGERLKEIVDAQSFNFFTIEQLEGILPDGDDPARLDRIFKDKIPGSIPPMGHPASPLTPGLLPAMSRLEVAIDNLLSAAKANRARVTK